MVKMIFRILSFLCLCSREGGLLQQSSRVAPWVRMGLWITRRSIEIKPAVSDPDFLAGIKMEHLLPRLLFVVKSHKRFYGVLSSTRTFHTVTWINGRFVPFGSMFIGTITNKKAIVVLGSLPLWVCRFLISAKLISLKLKNSTSLRSGLGQFQFLNAPIR